MVWAAAGNLPEQNKNNKCVNRPPGTAVKKYAGTYDLPCTVDGANASAVVYTMVEMAKAHSLNIYGYLKFLLEHRPDKDMTDEQLAELAPWSEKLQSIKNRM